MASVNKVILIGNLGRDPEIRAFPSGDPIAKFSLATTESWKDKNGQKQERTEWHNIEVYGRTAEIVRDYCTKGKQVYLEGSIRTDEWTDKEGVKRKSTKIEVKGQAGGRLVLLGGGGGRGGDAGRSAPRGGGGESESAGGPPPSDDFQVSDDDVPF